MITSFIVIMFAALLIGVYIFATRGHEGTAKATINVGNTDLKPEGEKTEAPVKQAEAPQVAEPEAASAPTEKATTQSSGAGIETKTVDNAPADGICQSVNDIITQRYVQKKDPYGNPWYSNSEILLKDFQRDSPANYSFYQRCVSAGKIQSL